MRLVPLNFQQVMTSSLEKDFWDAPCEFNLQLLEQHILWHWQKKKKTERQHCCQGLWIFSLELFSGWIISKTQNNVFPSCVKIEGYNSGETMLMSLQQAAHAIREEKSQFPQEILDNAKQIEGGIFRRNSYDCFKGKLSPQCFSNKMGL